MKRIFPYVLWIILAVPLTMVVTILTSPFWNWFESATGIESYGHSGPADWCFVAIYLLTLITFAVCRLVMHEI